MRHEVIAKRSLDSGHDFTRVEKQIDAVFNRETMRESIADALKPDNEPDFIGV